MTNEYKAAIGKHDEALKKFEVVKYAFRYVDHDADAYLLALAAYKKATAEFDLAFAKEASWK